MAKTIQPFFTNIKLRNAFFNLPAPQTSNGQKVPVLYWLSGLTFSDENLMQKAGAQRIAAELGIAIVAPDTSPRGEMVADKLAVGAKSIQCLFGKGQNQLAPA